MSIFGALAVLFALVHDLFIDRGSGGPGLTFWAGMFGVYCVGADMLIGGVIEAFTDDD